MKILKVSHLGIAPSSPHTALKFLTELLGLTASGHEAVDEQKVLVDFVNCGQTRLEILTPTQEDSPVASYLQKKGSGIHHLALQVDNIQEWIAYLKSHGVQLIDEEPKKGAHGTQIIFIHPKSTGGLLIELTEEKSCEE